MGKDRFATNPEELSRFDNVWDALRPVSDAETENELAHTLVSRIFTNGDGSRMHVAICTELKTRHSKGHPLTVRHLEWMIGDDEAHELSDAKVRTSPEPSQLSAQLDVLEALVGSSDRHLDSRD